MRLFKRISDIISANLSELVEGYEDPEILLKQAIREMEESIDKATEETAKVLANEKRLSKELQHNAQESQRWQEVAEQAVADGNDDRARTALARKQERDLLVVALKDQLVPATEASQTLRHQLAGMQSKLAEAKRSLATLAARKKAAEVRKKAYATSNASSHLIVDDGAFGKFDRMREKVEQAEAEAEALAELRASDVQADIGSAAALEIEAQLQSIKAKRSAAN